MTIRLLSTSGGSVYLTAPATSSNFTVTLPAANSVLGVVRSTAQSTTTGTSFDFTGIPSGARKITFVLSGVSTNGTSSLQLQVGNGAIIATGYASMASGITSPTIAVSNTGFILSNISSTTSFFTGTVELVNIDGNQWVTSGVISDINNVNGSRTSITTAGVITLGSTLDRVRLTTVNGTDIFDAGTINTLYV